MGKTVNKVFSVDAVSVKKIDVQKIEFGSAEGRIDRAWGSVHCEYRMTKYVIPFVFYSGLFRWEGLGKLKMNDAETKAFEYEIKDCVKYSCNIRSAFDSFLDHPYVSNGVAMIFTMTLFMLIFRLWEK